MAIELNAPSPQNPLTTPFVANAPLLYMNAFKAGYSATDVFIVLQHNGSDVAVLNISYTLAKTLAEALHSLINQLEEKSGQKIMNAETIAKAMSRSVEKKEL